MGVDNVAALNAVYALRAELAQERADHMLAMASHAAALMRSAELATEVSALRTKLDAVPVGDIGALYDAYAHAVAGMDNAAEFFEVGRWLGVLPAEE